MPFTCTRLFNTAHRRFARLFSSPLVLLATALTAIAVSEENVEQTTDTAPGGKLIVDVDFGTIDIAPGDDSHVMVKAYRKIVAGSPAQEKEYTDATPITITTQGHTTTVRAKPEGGDGDWNWSGNITMDARYTIRVPRSFNAEIHTGGGTIAINELAGNIKADTSGGDLKFARLRGPLRASSSGGHIDVNSCDGAINVETNGGRINAGTGNGTLTARTFGGAIAVHDFGGDAKVETSGGKLTLDNIQGRLFGETSGGSILATIPAPVPGDVKLETAAGRIEVTLPADAAMNLNAETDEGTVTSDLPILAAHSSRDGLKGTINGGGKALVLRTGAGSIAIKSHPAKPGP
jgi:DUF4097 and DUF4098 domain-containing protein YvlB